MKIVYSLSRENEDKVQSFWEGHKIWKKSSSENLTSKFVYSEKATKFCKICTLLLSTVHTDKSKVEICQILWPSQNIWTLLSNIKYKVEDFFKFCALLKKSELYKKAPREIFSYGTVHKLCRLGKGGGRAGKGCSPKDNLLHRPYLIKKTTRGSKIADSETT